MADYIVKALAFDGKVRAYAIKSTDTVDEAQRRHDTWPTASAALGRTISASAMMGAMLKGNDKLTVKVEGNGPIGIIVADANATGEVRGYVTNPHTHFDLNQHGKLDVARAVGTEGNISVVKDLGLRDYFTGQVPIVSGELGEDFTYYFVTSEQVPSAVGVGVLVNPDNTIKAAGGFIIQMMPGVDEEMIDFIEKQLQSIPPISKLIEEGLSPESILQRIFGEEQVKFLESVPVKFQCRCSKERLANAIIALGTKEIEEMIKEDGKADAHCHFCNENYYFSKEELEDLQDKSEKS